MTDKNKDIILNIPNLLSISRILLVPVFLLLIVQQKTTAALIVFAVAASTDFLDGIAARALNQKTKLGTYLDPAGDKLLMTASFIILSFPSLNHPNVIPLWLTKIVIGRDLFIVFNALVLYKLIGQTDFPPSLAGKICTICQMGVLLVVLFFNTIQTSSVFFEGLYILTAALTLLSGIHYAYIGINGFIAQRKA